MATARTTTPSDPRITSTSQASINSIIPTSDELRSANWNGSIPVILSLAPTSLSSPTIPPPIHVLIPRHTFLHVGLKQAVLRLHQYAPPTLSFPKHGGFKIEEPEPGLYNEDEGDGNDNGSGNHKNASSEGDEPKHSGETRDAYFTNKKNDLEEKYPVCWFEDEVSEVPLRWHLFAGVLFDTLSHDRSSTNRNFSGSSFQNEQYLPWKIQLHFTSYPSSQLLELDSESSNTGTRSSSGSDGVLATIERTFRNSLKQALFLQHGNSKVAMNMTKQSHQRLWHSIVTSKYSLYKQVNTDLQVTEQEQIQLLPVRLLLDSKPPIQKRLCLMSLCETLTGANPPSASVTDTTYSSFTLEMLLKQWLPQMFSNDVSSSNGAMDDKDNANNEMETSTRSAAKIRPGIQWQIAGIVPPLSSPVISLWRDLCHPDHFLYIIVTTQ